MKTATAKPIVDSWDEFDPTLCPVCHRDSCDDPSHLPPPQSDDQTTEDTATKPPRSGPRRIGLDPAFLHDAVVVIQEGRRLAADGIRYVLEGIIPLYGVLGMLIAYAKVGKTTFGQAIAAAVAGGHLFLDRATTQTRVLIIAAEDPSEYTAFLARVLPVTAPGALTFYRAPVLLDVDGLRDIVHTVAEGEYGLVLIASWQAVIRGLVKDENDNAGAVAVVEQVKAAARQSGIPWLIDAHSGKGEDQADDADPTRAIRGASGAAGAADFLLSLRYANGAFGTQRRLSGKGRFVNFPPLTIDLDVETGAYSLISDTKDAASDTTWRLLCDTGALDTTPRSIADLCHRCGITVEGQRPTHTHRSRVAKALVNRPDVLSQDVERHGKKVRLYHRSESL